MSKYLFVTGKLAHRALARILERMDFEGGYRIEVLGSTVAALMNTEYIARHLPSAQGETVVIPGLCKGSPEIIQDKTGCKTVKGPEDLKDLPLFFGQKVKARKHTEPRMKIIAEIVDAAGMSLKQIVERATYYQEQGADIIDVGADTSGHFPHLGDAVHALKKQGFTVSVDSMRPEDIVVAGQAGADLVLSVNSYNIDVAEKLECKFVVIPDDDKEMDSLYRNIERLEAMGKSYIIDPILPPLTFGFAEAITRYCKVRKDFPQAEMLMGMGNVTELTDADSVGINAVLTAIVTELDIDYILTTEVSNRAKGAVKEVSLARSLMHRAKENSILPKHLDYSLLTVKDPDLNLYTENELREMQSLVKDKNFRIFTDGNYIYVFNAHIFIRGRDAQRLFDQLNIQDPRHSYYLGRELCKADLALKLGKKFVQDRNLNWGYLSDN